MKLDLKKSLIILGVILMLGGFLRIYKLNNMSLKADEFIGVNISQGHHQTGQWKFWEWNKDELTDGDYTRGQVYYFQVSKLLDFVAPTEFNFRLISVLWGMIGIILMFFVGYFYTKNFIIALLSAFLWAVSISAITFDRHLRMYAMFAPVYLILSTLTYQFLETIPGKSKTFLNQLSRKTKLNWNYFIPAFFLLVLSFATHFLTINIFSTIGVYILFFAIYEWKKNNKIANKYSWLLLLPLASLLLLTLTGFVGRSSDFLGLMENNFGHFGNITIDYSHSLLAVTFFIIGAGGLIKQNLKKNIWLLLAFLVPFLSAVFIWNRSAGAQYIYLVQTFQTIIVAAGIYFIAQKITEIFSQKKWYQFFKNNNLQKTLLMGGSILYLFLILYNFNYFSGPNGFYQDKTKWDHANYKEVFTYYLKHREKNALLITRNFRNYYYADKNIPVFDFGGEHQPEKKLDLKKLKSLESQNNSIWIVISDNDFDYTNGEVRHYIRETYQPIETKYTSSSMEIWRK